ncbi:MAG: hypothetical protein Q4D02_03285 [Clostridia bacterium]|nr:hypothetical protein [Clostridia bacterium]
MSINKEIMKLEAEKFLKTLFVLPEIKRIFIKNIEISNIDDEESIEKSLSLCYHDNLSDIDLTAEVYVSYEDYKDTEPFYKKYFSRLGMKDEIFSIYFINKRDKNEDVLRICLKNGIRIDFTCILYSTKEASCLEYVNDKQDIFENDVDRINQFFFIAVQALGKLYRKDYLIADHLAHMLIMEGLVLQMEERDKKTNTKFHRYGYSEELEYRNVTVKEPFFLTSDDTFNDIADRIYRAVVAYDNLSLKLNKKYISKMDIFFNIWKGYLNKETL